MPQAHSALDLLSHYAARHRDQRNIVTHFVGVPLIVLGLFILLARARFELGGGEFSAAGLAFVPCALWYLSRRGAFTLSLAVTLAFGLLTAAAHAFARGSLTACLAAGLGCMFLGGVARWLGHCYEGRRPTLAANAAAWLVGPMFATAEALFALGWNRPLREKIEQRAGPSYLRDMAHPA